MVTRGDAQQAMDWLLEHGGDADIDEPLTEEQLHRLQVRGFDHIQARKCVCVWVRCVRVREWV